ncbi:AADAT [Lepeophtheirus salmonis]|uniref:AADAT n=1 Tax=Lepeophtheirus salmonis TaxID=72036 RepID=A0A7R8HDB7_LEPSM|nr:AADAT [Lepeophtheirus salmonis]CAF3026924.1 AADAT [Lepeophtheirus salmonis]
MREPAHCPSILYLNIGFQSNLQKHGGLYKIYNLIFIKTKIWIDSRNGQPNSKLFPFVKMTLDINDGTQITIQGPQLHKALQYQPTDGIPELISLVKNLQKEMHDPPNWENMDLLILPGSQDGLCKAMEMMLETDGKSTIITEEYLFTNALAIMEPYEPNMIKIKGDSDGMIPEELEKSLQNPNNSKDIKFIYINPTGCNPTDDPYYYLHFSKMMSSGLRLGFMTGPKLLVESFYEEQCKMMTSAATKYLNEVCEWTVPKSGMFLWISVSLSSGFE